MLGEGTAGRMAPQAARVAVEDVALLAHHRGLLRTLLAELTLERGRFALLVPVHDPLQHPVLGESAEPPVVQDEAAVTLRAGDAGVAGDRGQRAGLREQVLLRRLGDGRGENSHPVRRFLARGGGSAHEAPIGAVSTVRLTVQTHFIQIQIVVVGDAGSGGSAALRGLGVGGLHKDIPSASQANVVGARQDDGLPVERAANRAF